MKILPFSLIFFVLTACASASLAAPPGDETLLAAREAFRLGDRQRLTRLVGELSGHELAPYGEYWSLRLRIDEPGIDEEVRTLLARETGSWLAERLRSDWLAALARRGDWSGVLAEYALLQQPELDSRCLHWRARWLLRADTGVLDEARPLWFERADLPDSCLPVMEALVAGGRLDLDDAWARLRLLLAGKKLAQAKLFSRYLPQGHEPDGKLIDTIADNPARYLAHLTPGFAASRTGREMALYALARLARSDPAASARQLIAIENRLTREERAYAWGQVATAAAQRHLPEALSWFASAGKLDEFQQAWQARAALRAQRWPQLAQIIEAMPTTLAGRPEWIYWLARARAAQGRGGEARRLYRQIAGQPDFYGQLASEALGEPLLLPARARPASAEEMEAARQHPGLRRALAFYRLQLRFEAAREWNWSVRGMNDRQLLAAAELARRHENFDRAISTADRTVGEHDFVLRFPTPFRDQVEARAVDLGLDLAWIYGLMRQESRFILDARSSAGAQGLMQLMPATARWVAGKIGMRDFHPKRVSEMDVNVTLGTQYMKMVLDGLDDHPVLASAAYNAGPARARRWRADGPLEGAIYAETIPFDETRDYVKKVMSNAVWYGALLEGTPQSLRGRLGVVRGIGQGERGVDNLP